MARPSFSVDDELLEEFDRAINRRQALDELPQDFDRSKTIRMLMREFVDETEAMWGNGSRPMVARTPSA